MKVRLHLGNTLLSAMVVSCMSFRSRKAKCVMLVQFAGNEHLLIFYYEIEDETSCQEAMT